MKFNAGPAYLECSSIKYMEIRIILLARRADA